MEAIKQSYKAIRLVDPKSPAYEDLAQLAVGINGMAIKYIDSPSEKLCRQALRQHREAGRRGYSHVLRYINNPSPALITLGLEENPTLVNYVIENLKPIESQESFIMSLVSESPKLMAYLDAKYYTNELFIQCLDKEAWECDFSWLKNTRLPESFYWHVLHRDPCDIKFIPNRTHDMNVYAVSVTTDALACMGHEPPEKFIEYAKIWVYYSSENDIEKCLIQKISKHPEYFREIPYQYMTLSIAEAGLKNGVELQHIHKRTKDYEKIVALAISLDSKNIQYVKQNQDLCLQAVRTKGKTLRYVKHKTLDICNAAVENDYRALEFVPRRYQHDAMIQSCIQRDANSIFHVKAFNIAHWRKAIKYGKNISWYTTMESKIMEKIAAADPQLYQKLNKTEHHYILQVIGGLDLKHVPEEHKKICKIASQINSKFASFIKTYAMTK